MPYPIVMTGAGGDVNGAAYCGRFAPTPSGPLHFGSVVAALAGWLDARRHHGRFLVRIEDIDRPRVAPGADSAILRTLERLGLHWDGEVVYQSRRQDAYEAALARLREAGLLYGCRCSRREIAESAAPGPAGPVYPGACRTRGLPAREGAAQRVRVPGERLAFADRLMGVYGQHLGRDIGDFVLRRADGVYAYHLAVVVDDAWQGVTDVVRGVDLIDSTPRQLYLQERLGLPRPRYLHLPVAVNRQGEKLSKQTRARGVDDWAPLALLEAALAFLGQDVPEGAADVPALLAAAAARWDPARLPAAHGRPAPAAALDS